MRVLDPAKHLAEYSSKPKGRAGGPPKQCAAIQRALDAYSSLAALAVWRAISSNMKIKPIERFAEDYLYA